MNNSKNENLNHFLPSSSPQNKNKISVTKRQMLEKKKMRHKSEIWWIANLGSSQFHFKRNIKRIPGQIVFVLLIFLLLPVQLVLLWLILFNVHQNRLIVLHVSFMPVDCRQMHGRRINLTGQGKFDQEILSPIDRSWFSEIHFKNLRWFLNLNLNPFCTFHLL